MPGGSVYSSFCKAITNQEISGYPIISLQDQRQRWWCSVVMPSDGDSGTADGTCMGPLRNGGNGD